MFRSPLCILPANWKVSYDYQAACKLDPLYYDCLDHHLIGPCTVTARYMDPDNSTSI